MSDQPDLVFALRDKKTGQEWTSGIRWEKAKTQWEQHESWIRNLYERMNELEDKIYDLEAPKRQKVIIDLLSKETQPRTRSWIRYRVPNSRGSDVEKLKEEGKLQSVYHGKIQLFSFVTEQKEKTK